MTVNELVKVLQKLEQDYTVNIVRIESCVKIEQIHVMKSDAKEGKKQYLIF
jgi:hypothetical protein